MNIERASLLEAIAEKAEKQRLTAEKNTAIRPEPKPLKEKSTHSRSTHRNTSKQPVKKPKKRRSVTSLLEDLKQYAE